MKAHRVWFVVLVLVATACDNVLEPVPAEPPQTAAPSIAPPHDVRASASAPREDTIDASLFSASGLASMSAAGTIILAAGSLDYSFNVRIRGFAGDNCTGSADLWTNIFGVSSDGFPRDLGTRLSAQLEAAETISDGTPFHHWEGSDGLYSTSRLICVPRPAGTETYTAFFEFGPANNAPVLDPIGDHAIDEGSLLTFTATATDADAGSVLTFSLADAPAGAAIDPVTGVFTWTPEDDAGSPFTFRVIVSANASPAATDEELITVTVYNVAPNVQSLLGLPVDPVTVGAVTFDGDYSDPGTADVHAIMINCDFGGEAFDGDGQAQAGHYAGSCTYASPGVYRVRIEIADDDGGTHEVLSNYIVVYDPSAGFVTGGGWFDSPSGAYANDPSLTGKAHFGFVSKYQKGAQVPSGHVQFQFEAGDLTFSSTVHDWLVIANARAQFRGAGTVNGTHGFAFELTATDGNLQGGGGADRLRVRIWDAASGELVYDNNVGGNGGPDPVTIITQGSIVIHDGKVASNGAGSAKR